MSLLDVGCLVLARGNQPVRNQTFGLAKGRAKSHVCNESALVHFVTVDDSWGHSSLSSCQGESELNKAIVIS